MSVSKRELLASFAAFALAVAAAPYTAFAGGDCCAPGKTRPAACCKADAKCCKENAACCKDKATCCKDKAACCKDKAACCLKEAKQKSCCVAKKQSTSKPMACCAAKPKTSAAPAPGHKH